MAVLGGGASSYERGTPVHAFHQHNVSAKPLPSEEGATSFKKMASSHDQTPALTVLYVPHSLDSGPRFRAPQCQRTGATGGREVWVVRVGWDNEELRPWHFIHVYSIKSRLIIV